MRLVNLWMKLTLTASETTVIMHYDLGNATKKKLSFNFSPISVYLSIDSSKSFVWLNLSDAVDREAGYERTPAVRTFSAKYWLLFEWAKWVRKGNQMLPVLLLLVMESKQHPWWSLNHKKVSGLWYWPFILTPCGRDWFSTALWCVWDWFDCNYFIRFSRRYYYWQIMQ